MERALYLKRVADLLLAEDASDEWGCAAFNLAAVSAIGLGDRWIAYDDSEVMSDNGSEVFALAA